MLLPLESTWQIVTVVRIMRIGRIRRWPATPAAPRGKFFPAGEVSSVAFDDAKETPRGFNPGMLRTSLRNAVFHAESVQDPTSQNESPAQDLRGGINLILATGLRCPTCNNRTGFCTDAQP